MVTHAAACCYRRSDSAAATAAVIAAEVLPRERNSPYVGTGVPPQIATHSDRARMGDPLSDLSTAVAGRYRVERELGAGGMATEYIAEDVRHHRRVAIKVVRPELAAALGAERFLREITTTASLRHPHIVPLYDSGEGAGILYYVMPLVEGESLRDRLRRQKQLPLEEALRITSEVADALGYAHARGVIHRDIKPENILLESGHAVVADFGIAHAMDVAGADRITGTGVALGTPSYMSPEQAAGERELDARSDVYALGCVLYEMLAGQPPFTGPTVESVIHQHVLAAPPVVTQFRPAVSGEVATALDRALQKAPADRFESAPQFAAALARSGTTSGAAPTVSVATSRRRRWWPVVAAAVVVGGAATAYVVRTRSAPTRMVLGRRTPITLAPGLELDPGLSPDGTLVAYSDSRGALTVRQVAGGTPVQVLRSSDSRGRWPVWLPDGQRLAFVSPRGVELVAALGGVPRLLVAGAFEDRGVAVSPDGGSVAFVANDSLYVAPLDGGPRRLVGGGYEMHSPAWSPDGRWIAFVGGDVQYVKLTDLGNGARCAIWLVPSAGGTPHRVTDARSLHVSPAWASPRSMLYVSDQDGGRDIYQLAIAEDGTPRGAAARLTTGLNPHGISVSRNGTRLAYSAFTETSNAWSLPIPATGAVSIATAVPETHGNQVIENIGVSHDGRWLGYSVEGGGASQVKRVRVGEPGAVPEPLTSDTAGSYWAAWSPDGREIAFHRFHGDKRQGFVAPVDGGVAVPVTDGREDERSPEWSPDGRRLLLLANWATRPALHVVTRGADGKWSKPRTLQIDLGGDSLRIGIADWSPDGESIACGCGEGGIVIAPVNGGRARRLSSRYSTAGWAFPQWSADGHTVYHVTEDSGRTVGVVAVPVDGGPGRVVVRFDDPTRPWHRYGFRVRAGRMFFTLGDRESDVWAVDLER
jgi:serine/threonine-protein kinase